MISTNRPVWLHAIETAVPPTSYTQVLAREFMKRLPLYGEKERVFLDRIYRGNMIERRYSVMEDYGNMSSATIFFVLQRLLERRAEGPVFAVAFGPGLTIDSARMQLQGT
jgi:predicted naringenin-chalcone synthase